MEAFLVLAIAIIIFLLWKNSQMLNTAIQQEQSDSNRQVYVYDNSYPYYGSWWRGYPYYWSWWGGGYPYRWRRHHGWRKPWRRHGGWHGGGRFRRGGGRFRR